MSDENRTGIEERASTGGVDTDPATGQPIEEAEKNLSRHATKDSSPPVGEQWRTSVQADNEGQTRVENQVKSDGQ